MLFVTSVGAEPASGNTDLCAQEEIRRAEKMKRERIDNGQWIHPNFTLTPSSDSREIQEESRRFSKK
jgi:hypothetical protein